MGCDGGTIPTREELIKTKKRRRKVDRNVSMEARWFRCFLSAALLKAPVVACALGRLYNKDAIIEYLLDKNKFPEQAALVKHISGLRDVVLLNLHPNPAYEVDKVQTAQAADNNEAAFICPVSGLPMNGYYKFCYLKSCGCVMADKALKEVSTDTCLVCSKPFTKNDVVMLNPGEEEEARLMESILAKKAEKKLAKGKTKQHAKKGAVSKVQVHVVSSVAKERVSYGPDLAKASETYKSLFIPVGAPTVETGTFTCRGVKRAYIA